MPEEEAFLLVSFRVHGNETAARSKEDNVLVRNFRPLQVEALLRRVPYDVLKLHDWIHVELGVDLPRFPDVHASLIRALGGVTVGAGRTKGSHTRALNPLRTQATSLISKAEHLVR